MVAYYACQLKGHCHLHPHRLVLTLSSRQRIAMLTSTPPPMLSRATQLLFPSFRAVLGLVVINSLLLPLLYNRYFHPLRKFPGPSSGSLMDAYHTYLMWRKSGHTEQLALHKQHGQSSCCYFPVEDQHS